MKQYFLIGKTVVAMFAAHGQQWAVQAQKHPISTVFTYGNGDTVFVYDSSYIDSIGLRGWNDLMVQYPINRNDSGDVHIVMLNDSMIVNRQ